MTLEPHFRSVNTGGKPEGNSDLPNRFPLLLLVPRRTIPSKTASKCQLRGKFPRESGENKGKQECCLDTGELRGICAKKHQYGQQIISAPT